MTHEWTLRVRNSRRAVLEAREEIRRERLAKARETAHKLRLVSGMIRRCGAVRVAVNPFARKSREESVVERAMKEARQ